MSRMSTPTSTCPMRFWRKSAEPSFSARPDTVPPRKSRRVSAPGLFHRPVWARRARFGRMPAMTTETLAPEDQELLEWIVAEAERRGNAVIQVPRDDKGSGYCFTACVWALHQIPEAV